MRYEALVFDFFGVICSEVAPFWLAKHFDDTEAKRVKAQVLHAADIGHISQKQLFAQLSAMARTSPRQIQQEWSEYIFINSKVTDFLHRIKGTCRLGLLTNAVSEFVRPIISNNNLSGIFDVIIVSSEVGHTKPTSTIYKMMLTRLSVPASGTLMIDDNPENIAGAIRVGMKGLLFTSSRQLELISPHLT